jgi:hypothetical protein
LLELAWEVTQHVSDGAARSSRLPWPSILALVYPASAFGYALSRASNWQVAFAYAVANLGDKAAERFDLVNGLRDAIHSGQLHLMFQPQVEVATEEIIGVEALVRGVGKTSPVFRTTDTSHSDN